MSFIHIFQCLLSWAADKLLTRAITVGSLSRQKTTSGAMILNLGATERQRRLLTLSKVLNFRAIEIHTENFCDKIDFLEGVVTSLLGRNPVGYQYFHRCGLHFPSYQIL